MAQAAHEVDLDAYRRRIGYDGPLAPTLPVLQDLTRLHPQAIAFENLDPLLGRSPDLAIEAIEAKLVHGRRGGYCFEHNALLQHVLTRVGFEAHALGARVVMNQPPDITPPRTHMLLRVEVEGRSHVADVGFGNLTPTGPLVFQPGLEQATPHEPYRIETVGREFELHTRIGDQWKPLYRFHLAEHVAADHEVNNHFVATWPGSFFRSAIVAARVARDGRHLLHNDQLAFQRRDGIREERSLEGAADLLRVFDEVFEIDVPDAQMLVSVFERITAA